MNPSIYVKKRHGISPTVYHEKRYSKSSPGISDLATVVRNPGSKGGFALGSPFIACIRCQKPRQEGGFCFGITLHCLQQVSETQAWRGVCLGITLHCLQQVPETQAGRGILLWNHPSLFAAGVRNPGRKGGLLGNHPSLFAAGAWNPGRKGDLHGNHPLLFAAADKNLGKIQIELGKIPISISASRFNHLTRSPRVGKQQEISCRLSLDWQVFIWPMLFAKLLSPQDAEKEIVVKIKNRYCMGKIGSEQSKGTRHCTTYKRMMNKKRVKLKCYIIIHYKYSVLFFLKILPVVYFFIPTRYFSEVVYWIK